MPEIICNTSALQYLHQLGRLDLLSSLYGTVIVPEAVAAEIANGKAHGVDLPNLASLPWVSIQSVHPSTLAPGDLGVGEIAVLSLAMARAGALAVLDDGLARRYARRANIRCTGTCGILLRAKQRGLVLAIKPLLDQLGRLGFHLDTHTRAEVLKLAGEPD